MIYHIDGYLEHRKLITRAIKMAGFKPIIYRPDFKNKKLLSIFYMADDNLTQDDCTEKINGIVEMLMQGVEMD